MRATSCISWLYPVFSTTLGWRFFHFNRYAGAKVSEYIYSCYYYRNNASHSRDNFPFVFQDWKLLYELIISGYRSGGYTEQISGFGYRPKPGIYSQATSGGIIYDVVYTIGDDGYRLDVDIVALTHLYTGSLHLVRDLMIMKPFHFSKTME